MTWWNEHAALGWLMVACALGLIELATMSLVFLMFGVGAIAAAAVAALPLDIDFFGQLVVALVVSVGMTWFARPVALRHLYAPDPQSRTGIPALVGKQALVLDRVDAHDGRIKLAGEIWSARTYDPDLVIEPGAMVDVLQIEGATAVVHATHL